MNAILALCHFCDSHGPCIIFCTQVSGYIYTMGRTYCHVTDVSSKVVSTSPEGQFRVCRSYHLVVCVTRVSHTTQQFTSVHTVIDMHSWGRFQLHKSWGKCFFSCVQYQNSAAFWGLHQLSSHNR